MQKVQILGIGCICSLGTSLEEVWSNIGEEYTYETAYPFTSTLPSKIKRSADRFSRMFAYTLEQAKCDSKVDISKCDSEKIGTIFSSEYGPLNTNLQFCREVLTQEPEECSPLRFSNTVANACLGIACITNGYKGVSTMLLGSNNIAYAIDLLKEKKADYIFSAYNEEYEQELFKALYCGKGMENKKFAENGVTFLLGLDNDENESYCKINNLSEVNLNRNLYLFADDCNGKESLLIRRCIQSTLSGIMPEEVEAVIVTSAENAIDLAEKEVIQSVCSNAVICNNTRTLVGDTIGSTFNINMMLGAICAGKGFIHPKMSGVQKEIAVQKYILVTGYDISGNYSCALLER